MDFDHCDMYNHLLTRKCSCGGEAEMLIDFAADFEARCSKCHLATHAYMEPEDAAKHWNDGDDIMEHPLHIFWDDPEAYLRGEVIAIHISDRAFWMASHQSCDFLEAIVEFSDKKYVFKHKNCDDSGAICIESIGSFNPEMYRHTVKPADGETILFEKIIYSEHGGIEGIAFRWGDTWLFVYISEYNLILTRSSFDLSDDRGWPEALTEPALF